RSFVQVVNFATTHRKIGTQIGLTLSGGLPGRNSGRFGIQVVGIFFPNPLHPPFAPYFYARLQFEPFTPPSYYQTSQLGGGVGWRISRGRGLLVDVKAGVSADTWQRSVVWLASVGIGWNVWRGVPKWTQGLLKHQK
ncbi:MAG: hypothetical protein AAF570_22580, partial [Bacteroidota bacterium]